MNVLKQKTWSPFIVGALIGILTVVSKYFFGYFLGASSSFVKIYVELLHIIAPKYIQSSEYLSTFKTDPSELFQLAMIVGVVLGSFISAYFSKNFTQKFVPEIWSNNFGSSLPLRAVGAFFGGFLLLIGSRIAGGCTSGKAISMGLQLSLSAWVFIAFVFATGILTSLILYRKG